MRQKTEVYVTLMLIVMNIMFIINPIMSTAEIMDPSFMGTIIIGDSDDNLWSASPLSRGVYLVVTTQSFGASSYGIYSGSLWTIRLDSNGDVVWSRIYDIGIPAQYYDSASLADDSLIVVGTSYNYRTGYIAKINSNGSVDWFYRVVPATSYYYEFLTGVAAGSDGNFVVIGSYFNMTTYRFDHQIIKMDPNGTILWYKDIPLSGYDMLFGVDVFNNTIIAVSYSYSDPSAIYVLNYTTGDLLRVRNYGDSNLKLYDVTADPSGIYAVGYLRNGSSYDGIILKSDWNLTLQKAVLINNTLSGNSIEWLMSITTNNSYIFVGGYLNITSYNVSLVASFDQDLNLLWLTTFGLENRDGYTYDIIPNYASNILVTGSLQGASTGYDPYILQLRNGIFPQNCNLRVIQLDVNTTNITIASSNVTLSAYNGALGLTSQTYTLINASGASSISLCGERVGGKLVSVYDNSDKAPQIGKLSLILVVLTAVLLIKIRDVRS